MRLGQGIPSDLGEGPLAGLLTEGALVCVGGAYVVLHGLQ